MPRKQVGKVETKKAKKNKRSKRLFFRSLCFFRLFCFLMKVHASLFGAFVCAAQCRDSFDAPIKSAILLIGTSREKQHVGWLL
jgi:hypothetical protein